MLPETVFYLQDVEVTDERLVTIVALSIDTQTGYLTARASSGPLIPTARLLEHVRELRQAQIPWHEVIAQDSETCPILFHLIR